MATKYMMAVMESEIGLFANAKPIDQLTRHILIFCHAKAQSWDVAASYAKRLRRMAKKAHRYAEAECNRPMSCAECAASERLDERFEALCAELGATGVINGDPRGHVYHIRFPDLDTCAAPSNTWGGAERGWGLNE